MDFAILGPLRVVDGDADIELGGPRQQRVLACLLAAHPEELSADQLVYEVWNEDPPETASHVLRTYLSGLRTSLGKRITSDRHHYGVDTSADWVDAIEFMDLVAEAETMRRSDPGRAGNLLAMGEALWRGRPFGDLGDGSLLLERRASELQATRLHANEMRLEAELELGHHRSALSELESLAKAHPFGERIHQLLMLALYRSGRQADALRAGFRLRANMIEQLGIEPLAETRRLEDRILRQDSDLDLTPPSNLPRFVSSFVGRDVEVASVIKLLDANRVTTLLGAGGLGKTRLAAEAADRAINRYPDGVWWVDLSPLQPDESVAARVTDALSIGTQPGVDQTELVCRFVARRSMLMVLDNCERTVEDTARLAKELVESAPDLTILATSRRALNIPGEQRYEVPAMSLPESTIGGSDAERLFCERASERDDTFAADSETIADVARICVELGGIPFAIELAAGRISMMSPAQIVERLSEHLEFLDGSTPTESRHAGIEPAIAWSYDLLAKREQILFDRLSAFVGPFDLDAVEAVGSRGRASGEDVLDVFTGLIDASMVSRERIGDTSARFRLLDTMKSFARSRLDKRGEGEQTARDHAGYHLGLVGELSRLSFTPAQQAAVERLGAINDDVVAALTWALDHDPSMITDSTVAGFAHYWFRRGDPEASYAFGRRLLALDPPSQAFLAGAHVVFGFGAQLTGEPHAAVESMNVAIPILEQDDDWRLLVFAYNGQGAGGVMAGIPGLCAAMGQRILEVCDVNDLGLPRAYGLALLGQEAFFHTGDLDAAKRRFEAATPLFRAIGDEAGLNMFCLGPLACVYAEMGDFEAAERATAEASSIGGPGWSATPLIAFAGWALLPRGELDRAEEVTLAALERVHERSMEAWTRPALLMLAGIAADRGDWEEAARLYGACRLHLPPWATRAEFWAGEDRVRSALGDEGYDRLALVGASEPLDAVVAGLLDRRL